MATIHPRHVLCILGNWPTLDEVERIVGRVGGPGFQLDREFSQLAPDDRMVGAFKASYDRVSPSPVESKESASRAALWQPGASPCALATPYGAFR